MPQARISTEIYKRVLMTAAVDGTTIENGLDRLILGLDVENEMLRQRNTVLVIHLKEAAERLGVELPPGLVE